MRKIVIKGGNRLEGEVRVSGAKNAALPILAATILCHGECRIKNVPELLDVTTIVRVLRGLGVKAEYSQHGVVTTYTNSSVKHVAPYELVTKMRASFFVAGPILARMHLAKIPLPGGCAIGGRPVDIHIKGFEALGAKVSIEHGFVIIQADKRTGNRIYLDFPSVGATETIMMAATMAEGESIMENAAQEPEIADLANFLNAAGAKITGAGTNTIKIQGVDRLHGVEYSVMPDRIEAGTMMAAAAITRGDVFIKEVVPEHVEPFTNKLREAGVNVEQVEERTLRVNVPGKITGVDAKTLPFPGFPTDMQPQLCALLTVAEGTSVITETIFENRFMHIHELKRMGANIRLEDRSALIRGVEKLQGCPVHSTDLRAGAALLVAALAAEGETLIDDIERHLDRGYEKIEEKLNSLGAEIKTY